MSKYILDTNVLSEPTRPAPSRNLLAWIASQDPENLFIAAWSQLRPLIDTVGDPKTKSVDLAIHDSKGKPLAQQDVVIRPAVMTLKNDRLSVQRTDTTGSVTVQLRAGEYAVGTLSGDVASEVQFEIVASKEQCAEGAGACVVASPQSSRRLNLLIFSFPLLVCVKLTTGRDAAIMHSKTYASDTFFSLSRSTGKERDAESGPRLLRGQVLRKLDGRVVIA